MSVARGSMPFSESRKQNLSEKIRARKQGERDGNFLFYRGDRLAVAICVHLEQVLQVAKTNKFGRF